MVRSFIPTRNIYIKIILVCSLEEVYAKYSIPEHTAYIGFGGNTTPGAGGGIEVGFFYTTDGHYGIPDIGIYGSYAKTIGFGAGLGVNAGFIKGGRNDFNGNAYNDTSCAVIACVGVNSSSNKEPVGLSGSLFGSKDGGVMSGGSFTHSESNTGTITIGDIFKMKIGSGK